METKNLGERSKHQLMSLASRVKAIQHAMTAEELSGPAVRVTFNDSPTSKARNYPVIPCRIVCEI
jgi:hypothetical protein